MIQLNGNQVGEPGCSPFRYENRPRHRCRADDDPEVICSTCHGLITTEELTVTRGGRIFAQQIMRCAGSRKKKVPAHLASKIATHCQIKKIEVEITDMPRHPNDSQVQSRAWIDSVADRRADLGLSARKLADRAGIHLSTFTRATSELYGATAPTVEAIETALASAAAEQDGQALDAEYRESQALVSEHLQEVVEQSLEPQPGTVAVQGKMEPEKLVELAAVALHTNGVKELKSIPVRFTADMDTDQTRFWCELAEAMRRLTAIEGSPIMNCNGQQTVYDVSKLQESLGSLAVETCNVLRPRIEVLESFHTEAKNGFWSDAEAIQLLKDAHESLTDACTLRIGNLEHRANTQHSEFAAFRDAANEQIDHLLTTGNADIRINSLEIQLSSILADGREFKRNANEQIAAWVARAEKNHDDFVDKANQSFLDTTMRIQDAEDKLKRAELRLSINDGEINNLAKSVEHLARTMDLDEAKLDSLAKTVEVRCCTHADNDPDEPTHDDFDAMRELERVARAFKARCPVLFNAVMDRVMGEHYR